MTFLNGEGIASAEADDHAEAPPRPCGGLALIGLPYVFTQDDLLTSADFIRAAKDRGHSLSLGLLQDLHSARTLVPLYRVSDIPVIGRRVEVGQRFDGMNVRGWTLQAATEGRLRDSSDEGYSAAWPYVCPPGDDPRRWWNGFVYSSWQLLDIGAAISAREAIRRGWQTVSTSYQRRVRARHLTLALASLSTLYLPGVLGRLRSHGADESGVRQYRASSDAAELLQIAGLAPADLQTEANALLLRTHDDPLAKWLPLVRYASYSGWSKLRGEPLDAMWRRVAAEMLLRAYEDLAARGVVDPLPDLSGTSWRAPQHDRLTPRYPDAQTLERALADLGLSPHPKVILLVEGETELYHVPRLLAELGMTQPQEVRVQRTKGSRINPHLIARYGVTPRLGRRFADGWLLDASPTALVVAMDPEHEFKDEAGRQRARLNLQDAIREEVVYQGGDIRQEDLDTLVTVRVWGEDKYELANFTDDDLVPIITQLATDQRNSRVKSKTWEHDLRVELQAARIVHDDIKVPLGQMRVREDKLQLAKLLWPVLRSKCEAELAIDAMETPVLKLAVDVWQLVADLTGIVALHTPSPLERPSAT